LNALIVIKRLAPATLAAGALFAGSAMAQTWEMQNSGTTASLRGVSAVNERVAWASGSKGTFLRTVDGGATWVGEVVPGAEDLDFRAVRALDELTAVILSSGPGEKSRIYRTVDGGKNWALLFTNPDSEGFLDALAFWDRKHGIVMGDPVDGRFAIFTTADGGLLWRRTAGTQAQEKEGGFAASNSGLAALGKSEAWFGTGGPGGARVKHSRDGGETWTAATTPIRNDGESAGIFSLAFADEKHGVAVGGDYAKPAESARNIVVTSDGGRTWTAPAGAPPGGYRSAVAFLADARLWVAVGTSGSDVSRDGGGSWTKFDAGAFHAMSFAPGGAGWAVGPGGRVARFVK
jgi:photosystem II stability/assembly factor-like uncharacterized protein